MPPLPRWLTISYGPSRVPGNRVIGGGDYSRAGVRADRFVGEWHTMTADEAVEFVATHGVVLESASGPVPSLVAVAVGAPVRGSWWGHPQSHQIFKLTPRRARIPIRPGVPAGRREGHPCASSAVAGGSACFRSVSG